MDSRSYVVTTSKRKMLVFAQSEEEAAWIGLTLAEHYNEDLINVAMSKRKYYPNRWKAIKDAPSEVFESCSFFELMDMVPLHLESLTDCCLIRHRNPSNEEVKEYSYKRAHAARNRIHELLNRKERTELTIVTEDGMSVVTNYEPDTRFDA